MFGIEGSIESLAWDPQRRGFWIGHSRGLAAVIEGRPRFFRPEEGLGSPVISVVRVRRTGDVLVGTRGAGLLTLRDGRFHSLSTSDGLPSNDVRSLCEDRDGNLWIGTSGGLVRLSRGRISVLTANEGLPHNGVSALFEDGEGNLWIGTAGGGLARLKDGIFTSYTAHEGLPDDSTNVVIETSDRSIWVGTDSGLARLAGGRVTAFGTADGLPHNRVMALAEDPRGGLWVGTEAGLVRWDGARLRPDPAAAALTRAVPERLWAYSLLHRAESLWLVGPEVLRTALDGRSVVHTRRREGGPVMGNFLFADSHDRLWCGSYSGLLLLDESGESTTHTIYETKDRASRGVVYAGHADRDGSLWLATRDRGLAHFRDGQVTLYGVAEGLPANQLFSVLEDESGHLWMSSARGIFRVAKAELAAFEAGTATRLHWVTYGISDGLKSDESKFFGAPSAWKARDGRLWFATRRGVSVVDPRAIVHDTAPTPVLVQAVVANHERTTNLEGLVLPPGTRDLEIQYAGLTLSAPERIRFRYRLEGRDPEWVEAGGRRAAYYTNLDPGDYLFRVSATNADGAWGDTQAELRFTLARRFYQTTWWRLSLGAFLACAVAGVYRLRVAQLRARERRLARKVDERTEDLRREIAEHKRTEARLEAERDLRLAAMERETVAEERARIARELHDSLAQNFAGVSLQLQAVAADLPADGNAPRASLDLARRMLRHCQTEARRAVWDLRSPVGDSRPLRKSLEQLVARLEHPGGPVVDLQVEPADATLRPLQQRHVLRIVEEALVNAVTHGQARSIAVACLVREDQLELEIRDDGCGFSPEQGGGAAAGHFGLLGMQERAGKLGARLAVVSRPDEGTRVRLLFPRGQP